MYRKCFVVLIISIAFLFVITISAEAALYDQGDGTVLQVKDDLSQLLWLQDASLAESETFGVTGINPANGTMDSWNTASNWIDALNTAEYAGYTDWRLPYTVQPDPSCGNQNPDDQGWGPNCSASEMGSLHYDEFGGDVYNDSALPFTNFNSTGYWSGTAYEPNPSAGYWWFSFGASYQNVGLATAPGGSVIAVRECPSCTVVPEPVSSTLFLVGGATLGFRRFRKRKTT